MEKKKLHSYNLPGHGLIHYHFFPYAQITWDYLERHGRIRYLTKTDQLGTLRSIFPGAHHTRYEYVITQLATVCELCNLKGHQPVGFSLSSKLSGDFKLEGQSKPSKGDALQCLIILSNAGHLSTTFAGERALLEFFRTNINARRAFSRGLTKSVQEKFINSIQNYQNLNLHKYITLFILNRHKKTDKDREISDFLTKLFFSYMQSDIIFNKICLLHESIRKLTYIALDSLYTPVPFNLDLGSIFLSLEHFLDDVFRHESEFQAALNQLDIVLRDSVYMSPQAVIHYSRITTSTVNRLKDNSHKLSHIIGLKNIFEPKDNDLDIFLSEQEKIKVIPKIFKKITLDYNIDQSKLQFKTVETETKYRKSPKSNTSNLGCLIDYSNNLLRFTGSVNEGCNRSETCLAAFKLIKELASFELEARTQESHIIESHNNNLVRILNFLISSVFGWDNQYRTRDLENSQPNIFLSRGVSSVKNRIKKTTIEYEKEDLLSSDTINQIKVLQETLDLFPYRGFMLAYIGETEVIKDSKIVTDFDGLAFYLGTASCSKCIVVEAKNKPCGHTEAHKQLNDRLKKIFKKDVEWEMGYINNKGAYASIPIK